MLKPAFLCITNHHLVLHPVEGAEETTPTLFALSDGVKGFRAHLETWHDRPTFHILIDLTEEELKLEQIPHLNPLTRARMLENRANRLLRNTPFRHVTYLGRDPTDPARDNVLFSGLNDTEDLLLPWLETLRTLHFPLAGIWSIPLLTPRIFKEHMDPKQTDVLLLSINSGGLRQTFVQQGQMLVSRLSRLPLQAPEEDLVPFLHGEIVRMQGYLVSQRLYTWNNPLHVHVLCGATLFALLEQGPRDVGSYHIHPLAAETLAKRIHVKAPLESGRMDRLFGQAVIAWSLPNHYARPEDLVLFSTRKLERKLNWAAAILFAVSVLVCLFFFWQGRTLRDQQPDLSRQAEEIQRATGRSANRHTPQEGRRIIAAVQWAEQLEKHALDPRDALAALGELLTRHDHLILENLEWQTRNELTAETSAPRGNRAPGKPGTSSSPAQQLVIVGRVEPFQSLKEALSRVEQFMRDLRALPEFMEVQPTKLPLNLGQNDILQNTETRQRERAEFVLRTILAKRKPDEKRPH
ncbi:MAG: hypothetical protein G8237_06245 [Magnetococcales bacterium]|nr:hypothetical protein [Magnetococcales bacterium]